MPDLSTLLQHKESNTQVIKAFFRRLEAADLDACKALLAKNGVYVNPFASEDFPEERIEGRARILEALRQMRNRLDTLEIKNIKPEQTLDPEVIYAACDCAVTFHENERPSTIHLLHRFAIEGDQIQGWTDYGNPVTRKQSSPRTFTLHHLHTAREDGESDVLRNRRGSALP